MKKLLSLLMCFVFLQAQTFALRGGPLSGGGSQVVGAFSGVMVETTGQPDVGLFLLAAVPNGASSGQVVFFSQSNGTATSTANAGYYSGSLTGLSDTSRGGSGTFTGIFFGTGPTTSSNTGNVIVVVIPVTRTIAGQMKVTATKGTVGGATTRLTGTASSRVTISTAATPGALRTYTVGGWQTSLDSVGASFPTGTANNSP